MIQEEVADRLSANPGSKEYGMISVYLGSRYDVRKLFRVSRNCFRPAPNVDSAVISLNKHNKYVVNDKNKFDKFIKDAFQYKRKNLRNNLRGYDLNKIEELLNKYNYSLNDRAEMLPVSVYIDIVNHDSIKSNDFQLVPIDIIDKDLYINKLVEYLKKDLVNQHLYHVSKCN